MRTVLGGLSLLIVLAVVAVLARKQVGGLSGTADGRAVGFGAPLPASSPRQQSQQLQDQVKRSVEATMQQARPAEPDDK